MFLDLQVRPSALWCESPYLLITSKVIRIHVASHILVLLQPLNRFGAAVMFCPVVAWLPLVFRNHYSPVALLIAVA
jgi:hypothetical protein